MPLDAARPSAQPVDLRIARAEWRGEIDAALDPLVREELSAGLLELLGGNDWTVVLASQDVDELDRLADRVGYLANGRLHFSETVESLQRRFRKVRATFATAPRSEVAPMPPSWQAVECAGREIGFIDDDYDEARCRKHLARLGAVERVEAHPLGLNWLHPLPPVPPTTAAAESLLEITFPKSPHPIRGLTSSAT